MIDPVAWLEVATKAGATLWSGVPCSYLTSLIDAVIGGQPAYVPAANEGEAVAIAAGAWLGGGLGVALMQNSGLGNAVNPLTSLVQPFSLPLLLLVTWRGQPGGPPDEPQHQLMGQITPHLLDQMEIPWEMLPADPKQALACLQGQLELIRSQERCRALLIPSGRFLPHPPTSAWEVRPPRVQAGIAPAPQLSRGEFLQGLLQQWTGQELVIATTGYTGRQLYALQDRPQQLYLVGSMGCASSLALGLALSQPQRPVWVLDGDGALLMRLGALSSIGWARPDNLKHLVLDNACHESTGAQATLSPSLDLGAIASACGYPTVERWSQPQTAPAGLSFLHCPILPGLAPGKLPRPQLSPAQVARRFRQECCR